MAYIDNEEIVRKAAITTDALAAGGKLNPAQSDAFIDYVIDQTVLKTNARIVRFRNESLQIDKIGVGTRVSVAKAEAADPQRRRGVNTSKITLTPREVMTPFEIGDSFRENNIEGDNIEEKIIQLMAKATANDLEELYIKGDKLGHAALEDTLVEGGSSTKYIKDTFLALVDGWLKLGNTGHVVDAGGSNIGLSVFSQAIRALPTKFRRNMSELRWFLSPDMWQIYQEKLATRGTALGDSAASGGAKSNGPFGIPAVPVPLMPFEPEVVEHHALSAAAPTISLGSTNVTNVVVTKSTLAASPPETPYVLDTDYSVDLAAGTVTRLGGSIGNPETVKITYSASPQLLLTNWNNLIIGIGRDIRIEKDRDIYTTMNQYAITTKVDVQIEEVDAMVKVNNIGKGV